MLRRCPVWLIVLLLAALVAVDNAALAQPEAGERELLRPPPEVQGVREARVAVYFGTFDPVHEGHVRLARHTVDRLGFDQVLVVPNGSPPHKPEATPLEHRREMLRARLKRERGLNLYLGDSTEFLFRKEEFVRWLSARYRTRHVRIIMGSDAFQHEVELGMIRPDAALRYVVFGRGGSVDTSALPKGLRGRVLVAPDPELDLSSTGIRAKLSAGQRVSREKLHPSVRSYIARYGLYVSKERRRSARGLRAPKGESRRRDGTRAPAAGDPPRGRRPARRGPIRGR